MNPKFGRVFVFISVCFISFCVAALAAVVIVESAGPKTTDSIKDKSNLGGVSFHYEKENSGAKQGLDETVVNSDDMQDDAAKTSAGTYEIELSGGARVEVRDSDSDNSEIIRPAPSEVIESIPFKKKIKIIKKYMPKLTSQDIKFFSGLLTGKNKDFKEAKKRFYEIYTSEEIEDMYKIYKEYEEKIYESKSQ